MKIVLDTNILVSGLLSPYGSPGKIVRLLSSGEISVYFDARIITEYREVLLRPKFSFERERISALLEQIEHTGEIVSPKLLSKHLPDLTDEPFLEVAITGKAKCLITGNHRHYPKECSEGVNIMSPSKFLEKYRLELSNKPLYPEKP